MYITQPTTLPCITRLATRAAASPTACTPAVCSPTGWRERITVRRFHPRPRHCRAFRLPRCAAPGNAPHTCGTVISTAATEREHIMIRYSLPAVLIAALAAADAHAQDYP